MQFHRILFLHISTINHLFLRYIILSTNSRISPALSFLISLYFRTWEMNRFL